jgi:glycosyltransferase involved in cell wall biosynthesis
LLREIRPSIVHVDEEPYNLATWLALRAARGSGAQRLFYTWQNIYRALPPPFSAIEQANYAATAGAIAANADAEQVLRRKGFDKPIWVIPPGLDPALYQPAAREPDGLFQVGFVGRLVPEKGVDLILEACRELPAPWHLTIVGDGSERAALERLAIDRGIRDYVTFSPPVASTEVPALLQKLDTLVLPSRSRPNWREQFGRILMEAMACEVAVVGSTCGEIPRVIGDAGLVFPENNREKLAQCLVRLQRDGDLRRSLGSLGRQRVLEQYSYSRIAAQTLAAYRAILSAS